MLSLLNETEIPPEDHRQAIKDVKSDLRKRIGDVDAVFQEVSNFITNEIEDIEAQKERGESVWPVIDYQDIERGKVTPEQVQAVHRRGCLVVKGHFPKQLAKEWDRRLVDYVESNDFDNQYRGPGDNFFGSLNASRPEIYPIYWSPPQMEARQSKRMSNVQVFLNRLWKSESQGQTWFDSEANSIYPDRIRRRPPGTTSQGLGAHTDSGALERWLLPAYQKVFRHVFDGNFKYFDPWDAAYRPEVNEYAGGSTMCSAFRTFQGWTALSDMQHDQGVLFTVPIPAAMAYILLRPLLNDVPEDELCGVRPGLVLPITKTWHSLLLRGKTTIPDIEAGDSIWWHSDLIHGVGEVTNQQGWGNVMYIPATPQCVKNSVYARKMAERFEKGESPDDFPSEDYEINWQGRFNSYSLTDIGKSLFF